jgi:hypothetical protein
MKNVVFIILLIGAFCFGGSLFTSCQDVIIGSSDAGEDASQPDASLDAGGDTTCSDINARFILCYSTEYTDECPSAITACISDCLSQPTCADFDVCWHNC